MAKAYYPMRKAELLIIGHCIEPVKVRGATEATTKAVVRHVMGEKLTYEGHPLGLFKEPHNDQSERKWDYVLVDLASGIHILTRGRKVEIVNILREPDGATMYRHFIKHLGSDFYKRTVEDFTRLKEKELEETW